MCASFLSWLVFFHILHTLRFGFLPLPGNSLNIITSLGKLFLPNRDFSWLQLGREGFKKLVDKFVVATKNSRHISLPGSDVLVDGPSDLSEPGGEPLLGRDGRSSRQASAGLHTEHGGAVHRVVGLLISPLLDFIDKCSGQS